MQAARPTNSPNRWELPQRQGAYCLNHLKQLLIKGTCYRKDKSVYALVDDWCYCSPGMIIPKRDQIVSRGYRRKKSS